MKDRSCLEWFDAHEWPLVLLALMGVAGVIYFVAASLWGRFKTWWRDHSTGWREDVFVAVVATLIFLAGAGAMAFVLGAFR